MYSVDAFEIGEHFCLLAQRALKAKKILRVKDVWVGGYLIETNQLKTIEPIEVFIDYLEPCCLFHALTDLEEEFIKICKKRYKQECEMRTYYVERIEKVSEDSKIIEVELICGT